MINTPPVPATSLATVKLQFKAWRETRKQKSRIPDELWTAAVSLSYRYSIHRISKALHVNHSALRDRVSACKPTGTGPDYWWASCPGTRHFLYISATSNSFG